MSLDPKQDFEASLGHLNRGDFETARGGFQSLLTQFPNNPEILSFLGFAEANLGLPEGLSKTEKAAALRPDNPQILMNYAFALTRAGKTPEAIEVLFKINDLAPDQAPVLNHLTRLLVDTSAFQKAEPLTAKLVQMAPNDPIVLHRHIQVLIHLKKAKEAQALLARVQGEIKTKDAFLELEAKVARAAEDWPTAYKIYKELSDRNPENLTFKRGLAHSLLGLEDFGSVIPILKDIRKHEPGNDKVIYSMAFALFNDNRHEECLPFVEKVLEKTPDNVDALLIKGQCSVYFGQLEEAETLLKRVLELSPDHPLAVIQLTKVHKPGKDDPAFEKLRRIEGREEETSGFKPMLNYTLGEMYERVEDYDTAFSWFKRGNEFATAHNKRRGSEFNKEQTHQLFRDIKSFYSKENLKAMKGVGDPTHVPIFIVGMPRSGTTLLEQIVSSHPKVYGAGELPLGGAVSEKLLADLEEKTPEKLVSKLKAEAKAYAQLYLDYLPALEDGQTRLSDKMPGNFLQLGFLQTVLPGADYIAIRRNPLDICLSIYKGFFNKGFPFATDLEAIGLYYRQFHELMDHWKAVLPKPVLEVRYEEFVDDPEGQGQKVTDFLKLDWRPELLDFYKRKSKVITMSTLQVREPVHKKAIDKWRPYQKHLDPLLKGLGEDIVKTLDL